MKLRKCEPGQQQLAPEWAPLEQVLLTWPRSAGDWGSNYADVEACFSNLATTLLKLTNVTITAESDSVAAKLQELVPAAEIVVAENDDIWVRDYGPLTVYRGHQPIMVNAIFNGWGEKYPAERDNRLTESLHASGVFATRQLQHSDIILEGGAIEVDGNGTLMSRSCCLPTRDKNKSLDALSIELAALFGLRQIAWLEHGELEGDDTDAHIDTLARFLPNNRIVYQGCDDSSDSHYAELKLMAEELAALHDAGGKPYSLTALPWPQATFNSDGDRLPLGYANFLICNKHLLLPTYGVPQDDAAIAALSAAAPDFKIVPVNCRALVEQYGSLHCATMQIPA